jgi:hypothetical protein
VKRVLRNDIATVFFALCPASFGSYLWLFYRYCSTRPSRPQPEPGFVHALNNHGSYVYISDVESNRHGVSVVGLLHRSRARSGDRSKNVYLPSAFDPSLTDIYVNQIQDRWRRSFAPRMLHAGHVSRLLSRFHRFSQGARLLNARCPTASFSRTAEHNLLSVRLCPTIAAQRRAAKAAIRPLADHGAAATNASNSDHSSSSVAREVNMFPTAMRKMYFPPTTVDER